MAKPKKTRSQPKLAKKPEKGLWHQPLLRTIALTVVIPSLLYFVLFCLFTWPWITHFNGWFFTDGGDGLQNVWNMWWVNESVTEYLQLPWHTAYLHAPFGVTLLGQTLNPVNGFAGIVLQQFMSLTQAFNVMIIFSFVFGGLSMFWVCRYFTKNYVASLIGGAVFTFSSYHFAHAIGHMQLVSLQFIPLFILLWWMLLKTPSYILAFGAAVSLMLVLFSDYYYFLYSLILAGAIAGYLYWRKDLPTLKSRRTILPWGLFVVLCLAVVAPLPLALLMLNSNEVLRGSHDPRIFSTDILTPFLNGGFWRFSEFTRGYYEHVKGFMAETTVYLGVGVLVVLAIGIWKRAKVHRDVLFWVGVCLFFGIMSLGPRPLISGNTIESVPMPYSIMEEVIPGMDLSGMPVRMMVMVTFGAAIIVAMVLAKLQLNRRQHQLILAAFCVVFIFEMWPSRLPLTPNEIPKYVYVLEKLPPGVALDNAAKSEPEQLLHQTAHEQKMMLGYISRTPQSLLDKEGPLVELITKGEYEQLCKRAQLRYITTPANRPLKTDFPVVYKDNRAIIYDLKNGSGC